LQILDARERLIVRAADAVSTPLAWLNRTPAPGPVARVLVLRLERIGDLLMTLDAIRDARSAWPGAEIDLVVGSWNASLASLIADVTRVESLDVPWLAREGAGHPWPTLVRRARAWRRRAYDVVLNFEPDIRSNLLAWLSGAPRRVGYWTGGGGHFLTDAAAYAPTLHVAANARRLVERATGTRALADEDSRDSLPRLVPPADAVDRARVVLGTNRRPLIGLHVSGGRASKQWHVDRFAAAATALARAHDATIVLTGAAADRPLVDLARRALTGISYVDASDALDLPALAALMAELDVLISSDTGPMHLAAAMGTPVVALFGPSDPRRYGPLVASAQILRVDLWCSPCGRVRLPPERCRGHVPDCMDGISVGAVVAATNQVLSIGHPGTRGLNSRD
jgi:ADP-heptose:LPS heptosyltransferase